MQNIHTVFLRIALALLVIFLMVLFFVLHNCRRAAFTPEALLESRDILQNPYQGFYRIVRYTLNGDGTADPALAGAYSSPLVLLEINLRNYRTGAISDSALAQLDRILDIWARSGTQILLRFLYDWDGAAKASEPESLSTILTHMDQVSEIVNRYEASVYLMQGLFIGNWGEMHGSNFMDVRSVRTLAQHLHEVMAPAIYLSVRTPAQWRTITGLKDVPAKFPAFQEQPPIAGRLGLYNDGMLGSYSDLGTYGDTSNASDPFGKGTREEELSFQNRLCAFVPNGGEVVHDTPYNALPAAVRYLRTIHASYLNAEYDPAALNKWSRSVWDGDDIFSGCDGLTYVQAHLGYRYTARAFTIRKQGLLQPRLTLQLELENTGFGNTLKPFEGAFVLRNLQTGESHRLPLAYDFRRLTSEQVKTLTASLPTGDLSEGTWQLFFSVTDLATGGQIALANTTYVAETGILLGQLEN